MLWQVAGYPEFAHPLVKIVLLKIPRVPKARLLKLGLGHIASILSVAGAVLACACCGKIVTMLCTKTVDVN